VLRHLSRQPGGVAPPDRRLEVRMTTVEEDTSVYLADVPIAPARRAGRRFGGLTAAHVVLLVGTAGFVAGVKVQRHEAPATASASAEEAVEAHGSGRAKGVSDSCRCSGMAGKIVALSACPSCRSSLVEIRLGDELTLRSCSTCDSRWWHRGDRSTGLQEVLAV